ncbi:MAG: hypothetical protein WAN25_16880, partial [Candidatus Acidiferrum sp.]
ALFAAGFFDGCAYLCGYVVELALKARICSTLNIDEYPEKGRLGDTFKTHGFDELRVLAGMERELAAANKHSAIIGLWQRVGSRVEGTNPLERTIRQAQ